MTLFIYKLFLHKITDLIRSQYDELKYLTGNQYVTVEEKFQPKYRVRNNIKVILTTNDFRPLAVKNEEAPTSDKDNNFFFYEFQSLASDKRDRTLGIKLKERIGHYCRTELKERYDEIIANLDNRCRYMIPCPITEYSNKVYVMAKTDVELTIEELIPMLKARSNSHITYQEFRHMLKDYGIVTNNANVKQYLTMMQHKKVLSFEETRTRASRLGYKILVEREDALGVDLEGDIVDEPLYLSRLAV